MSRSKHGNRKTGRYDAEDRRLTELQTTVFSVIGKPIEEANADDREVLRSTLSPKDMRAVNEYARLMEAAIGARCLTSQAKTQRRNQEAQLGVRLDSWLKARLEEIAEREERSVAQLVRRVLKDFVSQSIPRPDGGGLEDGKCERKQQ
jgi:predicted HicB family RNase H-like nuclease